jgi:predicted pyridoxine 5'-phosphate oxidase superfamily flavin-nucleotide-binding protein
VETKMVNITDDMRDVVRRAILSFVATVNPDGTPNVSPKASLTILDGVLYFADIASPKTVRNLKTNPAIEINVVDIFSRRGYRFSGLAAILDKGHPKYAAVAEWVWSTNGREYPVNHVVRIEPSDAKPLLSPAYLFSKPVLTEDAIRRAYYPKYGVQPIVEGSYPTGKSPV